MVVDLQFLDFLQWCKSDPHSVETVLWILAFSQASNVLYLLCHDVGQWQQAAGPGPSQARDQRANTWYT